MLCPGSPPPIPIAISMKASWASTCNWPKPDNPNRLPGSRSRLDTQSPARRTNSQDDCLRVATKRSPSLFDLSVRCRDFPYVSFLSMAARMSNSLWMQQGSHYTEPIQALS